jgi:protein tyrosine phosphatase
MVWQEDCRLLVALTREVERGRVKCARYWPEHVGEEVEFESAGEHFVVKWVREEEMSDYTTRELELSKRRVDDDDDSADQSRNIYHQQFLAWEDNCCPSDSVLLFLDDVNRKLEEIAGEVSNKDPPLEALGPAPTPPVVVHCSAGIGRTGTFIVLDILLNRIKAVGPQCIIDIPKTVRMLREQRATMVQTEAQYRFIYQAISAYMRIRREHVQGGAGLDEGSSSHSSASPHQPSLEKLNIAG